MKVTLVACMSLITLHYITLHNTTQHNTTHLFSYEQITEMHNPSHIIHCKMPMEAYIDAFTPLEYAMNNMSIDSVELHETIGTLLDDAEATIVADSGKQPPFLF